MIDVMELKKLALFSICLFFVFFYFVFRIWVTQSASVGSVAFDCVKSVKITIIDT